MLVSDEYRRFKIRSVEGAPNDYLAMAEVIERRFSRGLKEQQAGDTSGKFSIFPDLVLVDGGKGQLNTAVQIRDKLGIDIPFIGLAERMEEIYVEEQSEPIVLPRDAKGLLLLRKIRDEAHRFALAYHRNLRGKAVRGSVLDEIPGVGPKRKKALIRHFGSVRAIREAGIEELMEVQGISRKIAEEIYQYMHEADRKQ
jgi:excinuclease ABC subunit C